MDTLSSNTRENFWEKLASPNSNERACSFTRRPAGCFCRKRRARVLPGRLCSTSWSGFPDRPVASFIPTTVRRSSWPCSFSINRTKRHFIKASPRWFTIARESRSTYLAAGWAVQAQDLDGSKIFTTGTDTLDPGAYSLNLQYLTSTATTEFISGGGRSALGGGRQSQIFNLSVGAGLADNLDLTITSGLNSLQDSLQDDPDQEEFSLGGGAARGSGLTSLNASLRWRFWQDPEGGRSLAFTTGPALNSDLQKVGSNYQVNGTFFAWQQSLLFRQDFDPFVANLEIYYSFPVQANDRTFRQFSTNMGLGWNANEWLLPVVELNYSSVTPSQNEPIESLSVTGGVILKPSDDWQLTLGVQRSVAGRNIESYTSFTVGTSVSF